jgi:hypothetical protein
MPGNAVEIGDELVNPDLEQISIGCIGKYRFDSARDSEARCLPGDGSVQPVEEDDR